MVSSKRWCQNELMRTGLDKPKLLAFIEEIGKAAKGPGRIYLVGGATALLLDIRSQTIDVDIKLDPEPLGVFERIAALKEQLGINVELASPDLFLPSLPGWRERSEFIARKGLVDFFHYDFYGQALAKLLRGHDRDLADATAYVRLGKVVPSRLLELFLVAQHELVRFPAIDTALFLSRVQKFVARANK